MTPERCHVVLGRPEPHGGRPGDRFDPLMAVPVLYLSTWATIIIALLPADLKSPLVLHPALDLQIAASPRTRVTAMAMKMFIAPPAVRPVGGIPFFDPMSDVR